jgi:hypothetical protein
VALSLVAVSTGRFNSSANDTAFTWLPKEKSESSRDTVTGRPKDKESVCPWKFNFYYKPPESAMAGRYYFYHNGSGNHFHCGHLSKKAGT